MSLTNSNTYIEPTAGTALNTARLQQNDTFRSLLTNFKSTARPTGVNISSAGAGIGEQDGMLYRSATTNALYISDSVHKKSSRVGGNFTRVGIGNRVENGILALAANAASYEIGELVATVSENGVLAANSRLYLCVSNTVTAGSTSGFLDVGIPQGYTIGVLNNVAFSGQSVTGISFLATANVGIGTVSPLSQLHVVGNAIIASNSFIRMPLGTTVQRPAAPVTGMFRFNTTNTTFEGYTGTAWSRLDSLTVANDTTTNQIRYITLTQATSGAVSNAIISSTKLSFNPSTGLLSATAFAGSAANLTSFPTATEIQAEAGTDNIQLMTPLRTAQAITALTPDVVARLITSNTIASGTIERTSVPAIVSHSGPTGSTIHSFHGFIQKGITNFIFDIRTSSASANAIGQIVRVRAGTETTVLSQTTISTSNVSFNSDQSVLPGDRFEFRITGGSFGDGKFPTLTSGFMQNVKIRTSNVTYYIPSSGVGYTSNTLAQ